MAKSFVNGTSNRTQNSLIKFWLMLLIFCAVFVGCISAQGFGLYPGNIMYGGYPNMMMYGGYPNMMYGGYPNMMYNGYGSNGYGYGNGYYDC